jgi:DNA polymerase-4
MAYHGAAILHADLDAFYASVEQLLHPELRGKAVAVGGPGVVLAASYEAKAYGVSGGMAGWRARELCPDLQFVGGTFSEYQRLGDDVMGVFEDFTPLVERISIDEAFLDVHGAVHLFGEPPVIATEIRRRVRDEVGLPISVGVASTKHLAKVASQVAKPDGMVVVEAGREQEFLAPLPVELLWGVGPATKAKLDASGIATIGELAAMQPSTLQQILGHAIGQKLNFLASNIDPRRLETVRRAKSVGAQSACGRQAVTDALLNTQLGFLADRIATRLREKGRAGRTITVRVRFPGMQSVTRSMTRPTAISTTRTLTELSVELVKAALADHPDEREITLLAISVSQLVPECPLQLELPLHVEDLGAERHRAGTEPGSARWALDRAMDRVRDRFGRDAVGHAAVVFRGDGGVPDAFRELAESHD